MGDFHDALQEQLRLVNCWKGEMGKYWEKVNAQLNEYFSRNENRIRTDMPNRVEGLKITSQAVPYYVTPEICRGLHDAFNSMPQDIPFEHMGALPPLPYDIGFVYLGETLTNNQIQMGSFTWEKKQNGAKLVLYEYRTDVHNPGCFPFSATTIYWKDTITDVLNMVFKSMPDDPANKGLDTDRTSDILRTTILLAYSFFAFIQQTIAMISRQHPDRSYRKSFARAEMPINELNVVELRRSVYHQHEGESQEVDWQYRWIVRPHWRKQWYPSDKVHRPLWIHSYVKGPEDKPLKPESKLVFEVAK